MAVFHFKNLIFKNQIYRLEMQERSFVLCYPNTSDLRYRDFIDKNLPLHRAPVIESLVLKSRNPQLFRPENIKLWVGIAVSRCVRELSLRICYDTIDNKPFVPLPSSLYTCCNSLTALKLKGESIFVDVPQSVNLPNLKTLKLRDVTYLLLKIFLLTDTETTMTI
uniref:FBD domain-containing protein n=1 Tax=Brassica oleracea TaxID=3712 RepID=A0A3P6GGR2_BRAOL|nr:unnamed protein product [Brassica oleracea]